MAYTLVDAKVTISQTTCGKCESDTSLGDESLCTYGI